LINIEYVYYKIEEKNCIRFYTKYEDAKEYYDFCVKSNISAKLYYSEIDENGRVHDDLLCETTTTDSVVVC